MSFIHLHKRVEKTSAYFWQGRLQSPLVKAQCFSRRNEDMNRNSVNNRAGIPCRPWLSLIKLPMSRASQVEQHITLTHTKPRPAGSLRTPCLRLGKRKKYCRLGMREWLCVQNYLFSFQSRKRQKKNPLFRKEIKRKKYILITYRDGRMR